MPLGKEIKVLQFVNYAISSGGGGSEPTPERKRLSLRKYDPVNQIGVAGAELTVYNTDGSICTQGITNESGYLIFELPEDGTYTYKETKAPDGYYLNPTVQHLIIENGKVVNQENRILYDYPYIDVVIEKKDAEDGSMIPKTLLQIIDPNGDVIFHGPTDESGECKILAKKNGIYRIVEMKPAKGYEMSESPWQFYVAYDGTVGGETTLYNEKEDKPVGIGRIYAHYDSEKGTSGSYGFDIPGWLKTPKAGDTTDSNKWYALAVLFMAGAGSVLFFGKKGKKEEDEA